MSIKEQFYSRSIRITDKGTLLTTNHKSNDGDLALLPQIGEPYSDLRLDLVCQDINVEWIDNENNEVTINWTTRNAPVRQALADKTVSTHERFSFSVEGVDGTTFVDNDGTAQDWPVLWGDVYISAWAATTPYDAGQWRKNDNAFFQCKVDHTSSAAGTTGNEPNVGSSWEDKWERKPPVPPALTIFKPRIVLSKSVHVTKWLWPVIRDLVGSVNNTDFLRTTAIQIPTTVREITYDLDREDDTGHWLFFGADVDPVGNNDVRVDMEFVYSFTKWNEPEGVTTNSYPEFDFALLPQPTDPDITQDNDIGRTP